MANLETRKGMLVSLLIGGWLSLCSLVAHAAPQGGWWWNPAESGRGYSVEVQGNHLFVVAFMYNEAGKPVWYYSAGPLSTPTHYEGQWLQFAGGQTTGGPYRPPAAPTTVGKLIL